MNIKQKVKQFGLKNSILRIPKVIFRLIGIQFESFYLMVYNLNKIEIEQKMQKFDYSDIKQLTLEDFKLGDPIIFTPSKLKLIESRLQKNLYWAYGKIEEGMLIYSTWISKDFINFSSNFNYNIALDENQAILEDSYCHPEYRGKGLHSNMNLFRLSKMYSLGVRYAYAIVVVGNQPALKTQLKSGFTIQKKISLLKIFGKEFKFEHIKY